MICNICRMRTPAPLSSWSRGSRIGAFQELLPDSCEWESKKRSSFCGHLLYISLDFSFHFWSNAETWQVLHLQTWFCGQGRLWLSFLTAIYLIHGTTFIMYAFLWEKKHVTNCLYILAPCKVFLFVFIQKKFNSLTLPRYSSLLHW